MFKDATASRRVVCAPLVRLKHGASCHHDVPLLYVFDILSHAKFQTAR